jgi:hypothetical protein
MSASHNIVQGEKRWPGGEDEQEKKFFAGFKADYKGSYQRRWTMSSTSMLG